MKKHYYLLAIMTLALVIVLPITTRAEDGADDSVSDNDDSVRTESTIRTNTTVRPNTPKPTPMELLRKAKDLDIQKNEDSRTRALEEKYRKISSTTPLAGVRDDIRAFASSTRADRREIGDDRREEVGEIRREGRDDMKNASSSGERREIRKDMRKDEFKARKEAIIKQLGITLRNLKQIRERIALRIEKATSEGRDMTNAKNLLVIADSKIVLAEQAISSVVVFDPGVIASSTASSTIDLGKPREVNETAIKALKKAHEALVAVVRAIAHSMGLGNATTTPPVTPPTATTTATTTASTTTTI